MTPSRRQRPTVITGPAVREVAGGIRPARASLILASPGATREADHHRAALTFRYHARSPGQPLATSPVQEGAPHLRKAGSAGMAGVDREPLRAWYLPRAGRGEHHPPAATATTGQTTPPPAATSTTTRNNHQTLKISP